MDPGRISQDHESINRERDNTTKKVILEARRYIENHYQDPSLSVEMICRELHMSLLIFPRCSAR